MGTGTYPDPSVIHYIEEHFIPVQLNVVEHPEVVDRFNSPWTPTLIVEDAYGREHWRTHGYLDPKRLLAELALARLKDAINRRDFAAAGGRASEALERAKGDSSREPEAIYWAGVVAYKSTGDVDNLLKEWNRLLDAFPESEWAKRVEFLRF